MRRRMLAQWSAVAVVVTLLAAGLCFAAPRAARDEGPGGTGDAAGIQSDRAAQADASASEQVHDGRTGTGLEGTKFVSPPYHRTPERSLRDWYDLGGWIMHLLVGCSVLVVGVALERFWKLRRAGVVPEKLFNDLRNVWSHERPARARELCETSRSSLARLVSIGIDEQSGGRRHSLERIGAAAEVELLQLRKNLPLLAALANIATMLGLLGTVLGMIHAFDLIATAGSSDARVVAGGIFHALVTTAAGLSVGLTALALHAVLRRRVDSHSVALEEAVMELFGSNLAVSQPDLRVAAPASAQVSR